MQTRRGRLAAERFRIAAEAKVEEQNYVRSLKTVIEVFRRNIFSEKLLYSS